MIRFAQAAKPTVAPSAAAQPSTPAVAAPSVDLLLADLDGASATSGAKPSKPRAAKKPKTAGASAAVQLDLDA